MGSRVLVIDNYDSFVYNLVQYLGELGAEPVVRRNDEQTLEELLALRCAAVVISPGPGRPEDAGVSNRLIEAAAGAVPVLGVCLGHQCIGHIYGASITSAPTLMHGKVSLVHHDGLGVLRGLPQPFEATRYHSLVVTDPPECLEVTAVADGDVIMAMRHRELPIEGVQFHPESILTPVGKQLLSNFLDTVA